MNRPTTLIVSLPPDAAERRRSRTGEPYRAASYSGLTWRRTTSRRSGWRHRRHYDTRATFITLAIKDGADPEILENRVTHARQSRSAFDGYNRGQQWERTCAEVAKLRIARGARREAVSAVVGSDPLHAAAAFVSSDDSEGNLAKPEPRPASPASVSAIYPRAGAQTVSPASECAVSSECAV